jgi:hypothetical protein
MHRASAYARVKHAVYSPLARIAPTGTALHQQFQKELHFIQLNSRLLTATLIDCPKFDK